jgi:predicted nucleic acid-binding Zn ribbon protein
VTTRWDAARLARLRAETAARQAAEEATTRCESCGGPIGGVKKSGGYKRYCTRACFQRMRYAQNPRPELPVLTKACEQCGTEFETQIEAKRFCTERCEERASKIRKLAHLRAATRARLQDRPCDMCGKMFEPRDQRQRFCSSSCRADVYGKRVSTLIEPGRRRR